MRVDWGEVEVLLIAATVGLRWPFLLVGAGFEEVYGNETHLEIEECSGHGDTRRRHCGGVGEGCGCLADELIRRLRLVQIPQPASNQI